MTIWFLLGRKQIRSVEHYFWLSKISPYYSTIIPNLLGYLSYTSSRPTIGLQDTTLGLDNLEGAAQAQVSLQGKGELNHCGEGGTREGGTREGGQTQWLWNYRETRAPRASDSTAYGRSFPTLFTLHHKVSIVDCPVNHNLYCMLAFSTSLALEEVFIWLVTAQSRVNWNWCVRGWRGWFLTVL